LQNPAEPGMIPDKKVDKTKRKSSNSSGIVKTMIKMAIKVLQ